MAGTHASGRKAVPTALRKLRGNPSRTPLNEDEPQHEAPGLDFDAPPPELKDNAAAESEWKRLAPMLRRARQVTAAERSSLIALCREWSRYLEAGAQVSKLGMVVKAPSGYPIVNPYLGIGNKALTHCAKLWSELGLTPSSRTRVQTVGWSASNPDPFDEFDAPRLPDPKPFTADDDANRPH